MTEKREGGEGMNRCSRFSADCKSRRDDGPWMEVMIHGYILMMMMINYHFYDTSIREGAGSCRSRKRQ